MVEVGRSCVHWDYRSGSTILLLWAGMAHYMKAGGYSHLIGCASVPLNDGGQTAARVRLDVQSYLTDPEYRVFPHHPFPFDRIQPAATREMPPLLKGYLRIGSRICGEPAWDPTSTAPTSSCGCRSPICIRAMQALRASGCPG